MPRDKKERKGGALPPWMLKSARVGAGAAGQSDAATASLSLAGRIHLLLTCDAAKLLAIASAMAISGRGLWDLHRRAEPDSAYEAQPPEGPGAPSSVVAAAGPPLPLRSGLDFVGKVNGLEGLRSASREEADTARAQSGPAGRDSGPTAPSSGQQKAPRMARAGYGRLTGRGGASALAGGGGLSGGIGRDFAQAKMNNSVLRRLEGASQAGTQPLQRSWNAPVPPKGGALRRLVQMNRAMAPTKRGDAEESSAVHTREWSNGSGAAASGPGVSGNLGRAGAFSPDEGGGDAGSPIDNGALGDTAPGARAPPVSPASNVTPYQKIVDLAQAVLLAASGILLATFLAGLWAKRLAATGTPASLALAANAYGYAKGLAFAAMAASAAVAAFGAILMAARQLTQGAIFTGVGALLTYLSYSAADGNSDASKAAQAARDEAEATGETVSAHLGSQGLSAGGGAAVGGTTAAAENGLKR